MDSRDFRDCMGLFGTGVVVITAHADSNPRGVETIAPTAPVPAAPRPSGPLGFTAQSFVSVSLDPPLVAVCPARSSRSWPLMRDVGRFAVNILAGDQQSVCDRFARSGSDKFAGIDWRPGDNGAPVLDGALASIECELHAEHDAGDHTLALGLVTGLRIERPHAEPLMFMRGRYATLAHA